MPHWCPHAVLEIEAQRVRRRYLYLRMIAGIFKLTVAIEQSVVDLLPLGQCLAINRLGNAVQLGIQRIEQNNAAAGKQLRIEPGKSCAKSLSRTVACGQQVESF